MIGVRSHRIGDWICTPKRAFPSYSTLVAAIYIGTFPLPLTLFFYLFWATRTNQNAYTSLTSLHLPPPVFVVVAPPALGGIEPFSLGRGNGERTQANFTALRANT